MNFPQIFTTLLISVSCCGLGIDALDCYTCKDVEGNYDDCIRSSIRCDPTQDSCVSYVTYKSPSYWTHLRERRAFITKGCITTAGCNLMQRTLQERCTYDMKNDWACVECCNKDLCNYLVKNASSDSQFRGIAAGWLLFAAAVGWMARKASDSACL